MIPIEHDFLEEHVKQYPVLVLVYADWCGHCTRFKPCWEDIEKRKKLPFHVMGIESSDPRFESTSLRQVVPGFPTLRLYKSPNEEGIPISRPVLASNNEIVETLIHDVSQQLKQQPDILEPNTHGDMLPVQVADAIRKTRRSTKPANKKRERTSASKKRTRTTRASRLSATKKRKTQTGGRKKSMRMRVPSWLRKIIES